jgi:hypothetical protein
LAGPFLQKSLLLGNAAHARVCDERSDHEARRIVPVVDDERILDTVQKLARDIFDRCLKVFIRRWAGFMRATPWPRCGPLE